MNYDVIIVGAGPGGSGLLTREAAQRLVDCDLIAGAKRIVEGLREFGLNPVLAAKAVLL